jgi:ATP/maltotriose-dependent transcriptional regulator MalT
MANLAARLSPAEVDAVRQAGLVHDLGRTVVSSSVWEKKTALNYSEWERVDGSGYHRAAAAGHADRQIALQLSVSERTAHHHVEHIFDKLGVSTRAAAAFFAMQHDLVGSQIG